MWPHSSDGHDSVKSGYWCLNDSSKAINTNPSSSYSHSKESWTNIWRANVPERVKEFIWRIKQNAIAIRVNMFKKESQRILHALFAKLMMKQ